MYILRDKNRMLESQLQTASSIMLQQDEHIKRHDKYKDQQLRHRNETLKKLQKRIEELEAELTWERGRIVALTGMWQESNPFFDRPTLSSFQHNPSHAAIPNTNRSSGSYPQLSPISPPYTATAFQEPVEPATIPHLSPPVVRRHKRTETPEQRNLKPYTNGMPVYTFGIEQQNDRGLLHDFFEDIRKWAAYHTKAHLKPQEAGDLDSTPELVEMMAGKSDIKQLLLDKEMRKDVVASLVTRHIVANAMSDNFVANSDHSAGPACSYLCLKFAHLQDHEIGEKHEVCESQRKLYTQLKQGAGHKEWRSRKADEHCTELLAKITFLLEVGQNPQRDHVLSELYIKGYRIGFRLRMEAVKWQVIWPAAGTDLNLSMMVNQSRNLLGDPMRTLNELQKDTKNFFVRFALTPTFSKSDFSSGMENKTVVHSSMVHVGRRGVFSHKVDLMK
jgi:hypothetical protein